MCGIAGLINWDSVGLAPQIGGHLPGSGTPAPWWPAVSAALSHRGPDGEGFWSSTRTTPAGTVVAQLGHRRLSILDHEGGRQPFVVDREPGPLVTVFNGCIYNHADLRRQLVARGHRFLSHHSDTEVIPRAVEQWGDAAWDRLDGMCAAAVFNAGQGTLTLARDPAGEKPLYYCEWGSDEGRVAVAFASTIPALFAILHHARPGWTPSIDPHAMREWIAYGYASRCPWSEIVAIGPGTRIVWGPCASGGCTSLVKGRALARTDCEPSPDAAATAQALLLRSVADRLDADVPLGLFLSGGIDSPLIAWAASRIRPDIQAFTVRMPAAAFDESHRASAVAAHLGLRHHVLDCEPRPVEDLARLLAQLGLPFGDSSLLPTAWVSAAARQRVTVALSGDGADELFDGYQRYRGAALLRRFHDLLALLPVESGEPRSRRAKIGRLADAARNAGYLDLPAIMPTGHLAMLTGRSHPLFSAMQRATATLDPSLHDLAHYLPDDILRKSDTASMSVGLELRAPFLSRAFVADRLARTPADKGAKRDLRRLAACHLPSWIARAPKSGFAIPLGAWIRSDFGGLGTFISDSLRSPGAWDKLGVPLDPRAASRFLDDHRAGRADHSQRLYHLAVLASFARDWACGGPST